MLADRRVLAAMARVPSAVTIVITRDESGRPCGFTASSFCLVSLEPPLVPVCLDRSANCHPVFARCGELAISVLQPHRAELARRFATKAADKFARDRFARLPSGIDVVHEAAAVLKYTVHGRIEAGDHTIILGRVRRAQVRTGGAAAVYVERSFGRACTCAAPDGMTCSRVPLTGPGDVNNRDNSCAVID